MTSDVQFDNLKALHANTRLLSETGRPVALLSQFPFRAAGRDQVMDLLLVPWEHSGYPTRLFFTRAIPERGQNWKQHYVADRNWWAPSWSGVAANLPWREILCAHIRGVA